MTVSVGNLNFERPYSNTILSHDLFHDLTSICVVFATLHKIHGMYAQPCWQSPFANLGPFCLNDSIFSTATVCPWGNTHFQSVTLFCLLCVLMFSNQTRSYILYLCSRLHWSSYSPHSNRSNCSNHSNRSPHSMLQFISCHTVSFFFHSYDILICSSVCVPMIGFTAWYF